MKLPKEVRNFLRENKRNILILGVITFTTLFVLEAYKYFFTNYEGFLNVSTCYDEVFNYGPQVDKSERVNRWKTRNVRKKKWYGCGCRGWWGGCKGCHKWVDVPEQYNDPYTRTWKEPDPAQRIAPLREKKKGNFNITVHGKTRSVNADQCIAYATGNPLDECIKFCNSGSDSTTCSQKCSGIHPST